MKVEFFDDRLKSHGRLLYWADEYSFDTIERTASGMVSLLINDLNIDFSEENEAIAVWGYSPFTSWKLAKVPEPSRRPGILRLQRQLTPGISLRITAAGDFWPVSYDESTGWLYIGRDIYPDANAGEFVDGCVAALEADEIVGLWLHPEYKK